MMYMSKSIKSGLIKYNLHLQQELKEWKMKSENKSRNYTTNWNELCKAFAN